MSSIASSPTSGHRSWVMPPVPRPSRHSTFAGILTVLLMVAVGGLAARTFGPSRTALGAGAAGLIAIGFWRVEVLYLAGFAMPFLAGLSRSLSGQWSHLVLVLIVVVLLRELLAGTSLRACWPLVLYVIVLLACLIHGQSYTGTRQAMLQYLSGPLLAIVTAWTARSARLRRTLLLMPIPFALLQFPVVVGQGGGVSSHFSGSSLSSVTDLVTGTLGSSSSGLVMLVGVATAVTIAALAIEGLVARWLALVTCAALISIGVVSVAFAVLFVAPVALGAVFLASGVMGRGTRRGRRALYGVVLAVVLAPVLVVVGDSFDPGWTRDIGGVGQLHDYLFATSEHGQAERGLLLEQSNALARSDGTSKALLGHGIGATRTDAVVGVTDSPSAALLLTPAQLTSGVWIPQILVEGGYLAVLGFFVMLAGLLQLAIRAQRRSPPGSFDSAAALALVGTVAFMLLASFYVRGPIEPAIAMGFWTLVGINMACAAQPSQIATQRTR